MIDAIKFQAALKSTGLSAEDFWLLYRLLVQEPNHSSRVYKILTEEDKTIRTQFSKDSEIYNTTATVAGKKLNFVEMAEDLAERGFLEIWTRKGAVIKIKDLKVTDKFKDAFEVTDAEEAYMEAYKQYPKVIIIEGKPPYQSVSENQDTMVMMYAELILKGNSKHNHYRYIALTEQYLEDHKCITAPMKLERWFKNFEEMAKVYEDKAVPMSVREMFNHDPTDI